MHPGRTWPDAESRFSVCDDKLVQEAAVSHNSRWPQIDFRRQHNVKMCNPLCPRVTSSRKASISISSSCQMRSFSLSSITSKTRIAPSQPVPWNGSDRVTHEESIICTCGLQYFTLKNSFREVKLGGGLGVQGKTIQSEFGLPSQAAADQVPVRDSIQALPCSSRFPSSISEMHLLQMHSIIKDYVNAIEPRSLDQQ